MAADKPAIPAPTTQTSARISWARTLAGLVTALSFNSVSACGMNAPVRIKQNSALCKSAKYAGNDLP